MCKHACNAAVAEGTAEQQVLAYNSNCLVCLHRAQRWWVLLASCLPAYMGCSLAHPALLLPRACRDMMTWCECQLVEETLSMWCAAYCMQLLGPHACYPAFVHLHTQ